MLRGRSFSDLQWCEWTGFPWPIASHGSVKVDLLLTFTKPMTDLAVIVTISMEFQFMGFDECYWKAWQKNV